MFNLICIITTFISELASASIVFCRQKKLHPQPRKKEFRCERVLKSCLGLFRNLESVQSSKQAGTKGETIMKRPL